MVVCEDSGMQLVVGTVSAVIPLVFLDTAFYSGIYVHILIQMLSDMSRHF